MGCKVTYIPLGELAKFESGGTPSKKERLCHNIKLIFRAYELLHIDIHLFLSKRSLP